MKYQLNTLLLAAVVVAVGFGIWVSIKERQSEKWEAYSNDSLQEHLDNDDLVLLLICPIFNVDSGYIHNILDSERIKAVVSVYSIRTMIFEYSDPSVSEVKRLRDQSAFHALHPAVMLFVPGVSKPIMILHGIESDMEEKVFNELKKHANQREPK